MKPLASLRIVFEMIKFEHTIFALPFALVGMMLAAEGWPDGRPCSGSWSRWSELAARR